MATTTNYSWTTPDDTDLVKDGAAAIRTLGSSIDTTTKNLNPQTTTGAIAYRSATSNVNTSLPIGTAGQVLQVNSGATAPEWATLAAGGMTSIASGSLSGTSVSLTSIPGTYKTLYLVIDASSTTGDSSIRLTLNADAGTNYTTGALRANTTVGADVQNNAGAQYWDLTINSARSANTNASCAITIPNYVSANSYKTFTAISALYAAPSDIVQSIFSSGFYSGSLAAVTSLEIKAGSSFDNGTYILYGVN